MTERELTRENVGEMLGLPPKRERDGGDVSLPSPEPDVPEISDTNDNVGEGQTPAEAPAPAADTEQPEQDLWLAPGIPRAATPVEKQARDRSLIELIHAQPEDPAA